MSLGNYTLYNPDLDLFDYTRATRAALREAIRPAARYSAKLSCEKIR